MSLLDQMGIQEIFQYRLHLDTETDRGCALMTAAFLEEQLKGLLEKTLVHDSEVFKDLFSGTGGLATFSSKINLCYLMGLIAPSVQRDLHLIRKIRNEFAHSMQIIDFNHSSIASRCRELQHNVFQDELAPRKAFNRVAFGIAGLLNGAKTMAEKLEMHKDINFGSEEFQKGLKPVAEIMKFYSDFKQQQESEQ